MTRPWSDYLRKATDLLPPMPVNLRAQLLRLLVPELADLRQQLDHARRLASEAQGRFREEERGRTSELAAHNRDTIAWVTEREALRIELARAKADLDERHAPLLGPVVMERDQLRARVAELEAELSRPVPKLTPDGKPITYIDPDKPRHSLKPTTY